MAKSLRKKTGSERSYIPGVLLRLFILLATAAIILAIGHYKYGWQPFGPKIHADQVGRRILDAEEKPTPAGPEISDVLRKALDVEPAVTTTTTPKPQITKEDQDALSNLLKKESQ